MLTVSLKNIDMRFETTPSLFSPNAADKGTIAMLSAVEFEAGDKVLDLGCGYGLVGILAAKLIGSENVVMTDIDKNAAECARRNAKLNNVGEIKIIQSDGFANIDETEFTLILSNPPYHVDFKIPKLFIEKGFNRLKLGGKFVMVTRRLDWYKNKLTAIFGGVRVFEFDGYYVFVAEKRASRYANSSNRSK